VKEVAAFLQKFDLDAALADLTPHAIEKAELYSFDVAQLPIEEVHHIARTGAKALQAFFDRAVKAGAWVYLFMS
jgi:hypothetical protein